MEWIAPSTARVLYIDGEMHVDEVKVRFAKLIEKNTIPGLDTELALENLTIECRQNQKLSVQFWDLLNDTDQDALMTRITRGKFDLVVFDNFTVLSDSLEDENSSGAMKPALMLLLKLKAAGVATILIHHANKDGNNYRGSSAIAATFEVILGLKGANDPREDRRNSAGFELRTDKFRSERDDTMRERKVFLVKGVWETEELEDQEARRAVLAVKSLRYTKQAEVAVALGITQGTVSKVLGRAVELDMITRDAISQCMRKAFALKSDTLAVLDEDYAPEAARTEF